MRSALDLFEQNGYERTTVAEIAAETGFTQMTFFRHFSTKHQVLFDDPYDELIGAAVADQADTLSPLLRATRGLRQAWRAVPEPADMLIRRRVRIVAQSPSLHGEMVRNNATTEQLVARQLIADGAERLPAQVAAAALMAALTAALFEWATVDDVPLGRAIEVALATLEGRR